MSLPRRVIVPIVEGHGEVMAVPTLLRNWLRHRRFHLHFDVHVDGPVRASGKGALKTTHFAGDDLGVEHYIELAMARQPDVILVILDADDDCPKVQGPALLARAQGVVPRGFPIGVVIANRMFETWFLAALKDPKYRKHVQTLGYNINQSLSTLPSEVEQIGSCKDRLASLIGIPKYEPSVHQEKLTRGLPFGARMEKSSRSFQKLLKELDRLLGMARGRPSG